MEECILKLKENGLKVTSTRLEIMKYLRENKVHPTADMIYRDLKKRNPSLSRTTVYNTLEVLRKHGVLQVLTISGNEMRYDCVPYMHHHFLCKSCGRIMDIDVRCKFLDQMLHGEHKVEEVHGYFKGICADCLRKGKGRTKAKGKGRRKGR